MNYFRDLSFCLLRRHFKFFHQFSPLFFQTLLFLCTVFSDSDPKSGDPRKSSFIAKKCKERITNFRNLKKCVWYFR